MGGYHQFVLRIPFELWERLVKFCGKGNITAFVIKAIREKLSEKKEKNNEH